MKTTQTWARVQRGWVEHSVVVTRTWQRLPCSTPGCPAPALPQSHPGGHPARLRDPTSLPAELCRCKGRRERGETWASEKGAAVTWCTRVALSAFHPPLACPAQRCRPAPRPPPCPARLRHRARRGRLGSRALGPQPRHSTPIRGMPPVPSVRRCRRSRPAREWPAGPPPSAPWSHGPAAEAGTVQLHRLKLAQEKCVQGVPEPKLSPQLATRVSGAPGRPC